MDADVQETVVDEAQAGEGTEHDPLRELMVRAYPDVVPELLSGETVEEMLASVPAAQAAYQRIAREVQPERPDPVPAGGGTARAFPMDVSAMSPALKIREGLRRAG